MEERELRNWYLLLDSTDKPLGRGELISPEGASALQVRVADGKIGSVIMHDEVQLVCLGRQERNLLGRILHCRDDVLELEQIKTLDAHLRHNLRLVMHFDSYIYPLTGSWKGRRTIVSVDLSCGGIAFFCQDELKVGEKLEVVIPITSEPLILTCEILRLRPSAGNVPLYAAKFVDLCDDEDRMLREAIFSMQLSGRDSEK